MENLLNLFDNGIIKDYTKNILTNNSTLFKIKQIKIKDRIINDIDCYESYIKSEIKYFSNIDILSICKYIKYINNKTCKNNDINIIIDILNNDDTYIFSEIIDIQCNLYANIKNNKKKLKSYNICFLFIIYILQNILPCNSDKNIAIVNTLVYLKSHITSMLCNEYY